jgi:uncharacterized membrane protein required for colicin V production
MFNFVDLFVVFALVIFAWQGYMTGFVGGILNLLTTIASFLLAAVFYPALGSFLTRQFGWSENLSFVAAFFLILIMAEIVLSLLASLLYKVLVTPLHKRFPTFVKSDQIFGVIPSLLVGSILVSLILLLPLVLPLNPSLRDSVSNSWWGRQVLTRALASEPRFEAYLNRLPYKNLIYLLTPNPESEESIKLSIPASTSFQTDEASEKRMLELVNQERSGRGLNSVVANTKLTEVGRKHCLDMFQRSYFSHYTPEGKSPFDRMKESGVTYIFAGENLAYAPSVDIAHQGLMNSPGHKENILRAEFGHLGIGVIDGGFSGKMFCQEFTN